MCTHTDIYMIFSACFTTLMWPIFTMFFKVFDFSIIPVTYRTSESFSATLQVDCEYTHPCACKPAR